MSVCPEDPENGLKNVLIPCCWRRLQDQFNFLFLLVLTSFYVESHKVYKFRKVIKIQNSHGFKKLHS